ncbi:MAG: TRAP transporter small permease [Limnochordia bacterium]
MPGQKRVARLLYVWGCFFGAAVLVRQKRIIRVDVVSGALSASLARILELIVLLSMLAFSLVLVVKGFEFTQSIAQDRLTLLGYPRNWFWLPIPLAGIFCQHVHLGTDPRALGRMVFAFCATELVSSL